MKTATEVGGDYYDFHVHMDGTLTVILGDATGTWNDVRNDGFNNEIAFYV